MQASKPESSLLTQNFAAVQPIQTAVADVVAAAVQAPQAQLNMLAQQDDQPVIVAANTSVQGTQPETAKLSNVAPEPVRLAQATPAREDNKGAAVLPASGSEKKDDGDAAVVAKEDENDSGGLLWGLLGLGALLAGAGGGSSSPTNVAAFIEGADTGEVTEAGGYRNNISAEGDSLATGTLTATDPDSPSTWQAASGATTYGNYTVDEQGNWTYTLDDSKEGLKDLDAGLTDTDSFVVRTADGTSQTVTITINGADDLTALELGVSNGSRVVFNPNPTPGSYNDPKGNIASVVFENGMAIEFEGEDLYAPAENFQDLDKGEVSADTFSLLIGTYDDEAGDFANGTQNTDVDIMVLWDETGTSNANYGYVLEGLKSGDQFSVEGTTYTYTYTDIAGGAVV